MPSLPPVSVIPARTDELTTHDRIVEVAARLFHRHGYHATTMRQIADGVGIKAASLYNHFAGKQELLYTISYGTMCDMLASVLEALAGVPEPDEQLRVFVRTHTKYCIVERYRARVADELRDLYPENLLDVVAMRDRYEAVLRGILEALDTSSGGGVRDIPLVANAIGTMASQVATWYRDDGRLTPDEIADLYAELALGAALPALTQAGARRRRLS